MMYTSATAVVFGNCVAIDGPQNKGFDRAIRENIVATHRMWDEKPRIWVVWHPYTNDALVIARNYYAMQNKMKVPYVYVEYPLGAKYDYDDDQMEYITWDVAIQYALQQRESARYNTGTREQYGKRTSGFQWRETQQSTEDDYRSYQEAFRTYSQRGQNFTGFGTPPRTVTRTPRQILFVTEDAPVEVVTAAYRALAKKYHPDTGSGDHANMLRINEAYKKITGS